MSEERNWWLHQWSDDLVGLLRVPPCAVQNPAGSDRRRQMAVLLGAPTSQLTFEALLAPLALCVARPPQTTAAAGQQPRHQ